jgi:hypothetical protein
MRLRVALRAAPGLAGLPWEQLEVACHLPRPARLVAAAPSVGSVVLLPDRRLLWRVCQGARLPAKGEALLTATLAAEDGPDGPDSLEEEPGAARVSFRVAGAGASGLLPQAAVRVQPPPPAAPQVVLERVLVSAPTYLLLNSCAPPPPLLLDGPAPVPLP